MENQSSDPKQTSYWDKLAARYFAMPAPLVPTPEDIQLYWVPIAEWLTDNPPPQVLVLGATPAFHDMPWPAGSDLLAVDRSGKMLQALWPAGTSATRCEDWTSMSLEDSSRDIVLCDGGISVLRYPAQVAQLAKELHRVMRADGLFIVRLYCSCVAPLSMEEIQNLIKTGEIRNSSELKLCLWLMQEKNSSVGVKLHSIWQSLYQAMPDFANVVSNLGWDAQELNAMNAYENQEEIYEFPSVAEVCNVFCQEPGGFEHVATQFASFRFAEYAPIVSLRAC